MQRQDAAAIAAIYGDDAVFVAAGGDVVRGRGALERFERERFAQTGRVLEGTILDDDLTRAGELIYEWGHVTTRVKRSDETATVVTGRFLTVWALDSNGRWRIIRNLSRPSAGVDAWRHRDRHRRTAKSRGPDEGNARSVRRSGVLLHVQ